MDAVAFSVIDMNLKAGLPVRELVLALMLASIANTLTKGGLVFFLGAKSMRRPIACSPPCDWSYKSARSAFYDIIRPKCSSLYRQELCQT